MKKILFVLSLMMNFQIYAVEITSCLPPIKLTDLSADQRKECKDECVNARNLYANAETNITEPQYIQCDSVIKEASRLNNADSATAGDSDDPLCRGADEAAKWLDEGSKKNRYPGSSALNECETLSRGNIRKLYGMNGTASAQGFTWGPYAHAAACEKYPKVKDAAKRNKEEKEAIMEALAPKCEAAAYVISSFNRNWDDQEDITPVSGTSSGPTQAAGATVASIAAAGSTIKCVSQGIETVDYAGCKKFQTQLSLIEVVQQVGYQTQELVYKDKALDAQTKYAAEENTATGALKATRDSYEQQKDMYNQRTAVDATKLAYLYSIYNDMPRSKDVDSKCSGIVGRGHGLSVTQTNCKAATLPGAGFALLLNQQQTEAMRSKLIAIATSAGSNLILAGLMGKRADDVNNAIAKVDEFKPIDPFTTTESEAISTYCKLNPGLPQCLTGGLERTFDTMNDNIISFGEGGTGTNYVEQKNADGTSAVGSTTADINRAAVAPVGSIIASAATDDAMEKAAAAKITAGQVPGGGGGGGGGTSGGGGGGGGAPTPTGGAGGVAAAIQGKTPAYGGGAGGLSVMGGFGINKKKAEGKSEDNPFGKLFGKEAANGSGVVNFRDIASQKVGGKGDNLFEMISGRYKSVNADKRLLEYELTK